MKKRNILTAIVLAAIFSINGICRIIEVEEGIYKINQAIQEASDGDILKLVTMNGLYTDSVIVIDKRIKLISDHEDNKPVIKFALAQIGEIPDKFIRIRSDITLENLIIDGDCDTDTLLNFIEIEDTINNVTDLRINGCVLKNCNFHPIHQANIATNSISLDTIIITNCTFQDASQAALHLAADNGMGTDPNVYYLKVEDCTFSNVKIIGRISSRVGTSTIHINHNTAANISSKGLIVRDFESGYIKNSIFYNIGDNMLDVKGEPSVTSHIIYSGVAGSVVKNDIQLGANCLLSDPLFEDVTSNDLRLQVGSQAIDAGDDGYNLGNRNLDPDFITGTDNSIFEPNSFSLFNSPNPFSDQTTIQFNLEKSEIVELNIYNNLGQNVAVLIPGKVYTKGKHQVEFYTGGLAPGLYYCKISTSSNEKIRKMQLSR